MTAMQVSNLHEMYTGKWRKCPWVCCVSPPTSLEGSNSKSAQLWSSGTVSTEPGHTLQNQPKPHLSHRRSLRSHCKKVLKRVTPMEAARLQQPWGLANPEHWGSGCGNGLSPSWESGKQHYPNTTLGSPAAAGSVLSLVRNRNWCKLVKLCWNLGENILMHKRQSLFIQP